MTFRQDTNLKEGRILIVDDNLSNVKLLERVLGMSGYSHIRSVTDPRQALDTFRAFQPDIILLDISMPYLDGFEVLEQLKRHGDDPYLSVIMISAQSEQENRMRALDLGVNDFIGKPFEASEVQMRIRNLLHIRQLHLQVLEHNRTLEQRVEERTQELRDLQVELVTRLTKAAEFRDNGTGNHIVRIGRYAEHLAHLADLSPHYCQAIGHAAIMHDVGKIGIPDEILLKPGPLTDAEWTLMKEHTAIGSDILTGSGHELIRMGEVVALTHHEWWNGTGYPQGLAGDAIPICGRIVALCDVFDALISNRPYKAAWPLDVTFGAIERKAGTQFDPALVDLFLAHRNDFLRIWEEKQDRREAPSRPDDIPG